MTRFEREEWDIVPGGPLRLFETAIGKIGVLICYDGEFPLGSIRISYAHGPTGRIPTAAARTARGVGCLGSTAR